MEGEAGTGVGKLGGGFALVGEPGLRRRGDGLAGSGGGGGESKSARPDSKLEHLQAREERVWAGWGA
ncbi:hypothetical protein LTR65_006450 [Meristemomyces frigidus]